jgi:hexokinase
MGDVTSNTGSLLDEASKDIKDQIERLEDIFTVPTDKLKKITDHFMSELDKGLSVEGGSIVSFHSTKY